MDMHLCAVDPFKKSLMMHYRHKIQSCISCTPKFTQSINRFPCEMFNWFFPPRCFLLCLQVLLALQRLVNALGPDSLGCYSLILPILQQCTSINQVRLLHLTSWRQLYLYQPIKALSQCWWSCCEARHSETLLQCRLWCWQMPQKRNALRREGGAGGRGGGLSTHNAVIECA